MIVKGILRLGFLAEGIAETALKEKIRKFIGENEKEF